MADIERPPRAARLLHPIVDRERDDLETLPAEDADGARHVKGGGDEDPAAFDPGEQRLGLDGVLVGVARSLLVAEALGIEPEFGEQTPRHLAFRPAAMVHAVREAGDDDGQVRVRAGQRCRRRQPFRGVAEEVGIPLGGDHPVTGRAAEDDDAVDRRPVDGRGRKPVLQRSQGRCRQRRQPDGRGAGEGREHDASGRAPVSEDHREARRGEQREQERLGIGEDAYGLGERVHRSSASAGRRGRPEDLPPRHR